MVNKLVNRETEVSLETLTKRSVYSTLIYRQAADRIPSDITGLQSRCKLRKIRSDKIVISLP